MSPRSSETEAFVQWLKNGNPNVSTAKCLLMPFVALYKQNPFELTLALQVFFTAWESMMINVVHLAFFLLVDVLDHVKYLEYFRSHLGLATAENA